MISVFDRLENILGKGENAGYQDFFLVPKCLQKPPSLSLYQTINSRLPNSNSLQMTISDLIKIAESSLVG